MENFSFLRWETLVFEKLFDRMIFERYMQVSHSREKSGAGIFDNSNRLQPQRTGIQRALSLELLRLDRHGKRVQLHMERLGRPNPPGGLHPQHAVLGHLGYSVRSWQLVQPGRTAQQRVVQRAGNPGAVLIAVAAVRGRPRRLFLRLRQFRPVRTGNSVRKWHYDYHTVQPADFVRELWLFGTRTRFSPPNQRRRRGTLRFGL